VSGLLVGIDLGSTTSRCVIFTPEGDEVAAAYQEVPVDYPRPAWAEVPQERWWEAIAAVTRRAVGQVDRRQIVGVGLSGLMHAPTLLDAEDRPLAPAMLWMDQRCAAQAAAIGTPTTVSAPKLRWIAETHPELLARARSFVLSKDTIRIRLTGVAGTDTSDAGGTGMWDRERGTWLPDAAERAKIPASLLPVTRRPTDLAGRVTAEAAAATGLPEGTGVAVGGSDVHCCRLGVGPLGPEEICLYMGTASWMSFGNRGFGSTATTGAALRWTRDLLGARSYDEALDGAEAIEPGAEGLLFLTHLNGERGPKPEPHARGALIGLTLRHTRAHVARATLEGTALQIRRNFEERAASPVEGGVVSGGSSKSRLWMQILVDVTGTPLRVPEHSESSVLGAAMLGGVAAGAFASAEEAQSRMSRPGPTYVPDPDRHARYDQVYERYCQLDEMLMPWFRTQGGSQ
jgi:xylulokinase